MPTAVRCEALVRELRAVWKHVSAERGGKAAPGWRPRPALLAAASRLRNVSLEPLVRLALRADRTIKGREVGDPWDALAMLVARFVGVSALSDAA